MAGETPAYTVLGVGHLRALRAGDLSSLGAWETDASLEGMRRGVERGGEGYDVLCMVPDAGILGGGYNGTSQSRGPISPENVLVLDYDPHTIDLPGRSHTTMGGQDMNQTPISLQSLLDDLFSGHLLYAVLSSDKLKSLRDGYMPAQSEWTGNSNGNGLIIGNMESRVLYGNPSLSDDVLVSVRGDRLSFTHNGNGTSRNHYSLPLDQIRVLAWNPRVAFRDDTSGSPHPTQSLEEFASLVR